MLSEAVHGIRQLIMGYLKGNVHKVSLAVYLQEETTGRLKESAMVS